MKVKIQDIPEEGLVLSERFDPIALNLQTEELKFTEPIEVTATFQKDPESVRVDVRTRGRQERICGRCLESYPQTYDERFDLGYSVKGRLLLDLTDDIRQEILLTYPMKFLCRPDCKGLCIRCGANLNRGKCGCPPHAFTEA